MSFMDKHNASSEFKPLNIAILTISDTRDEATDSSGRALAEGLLSLSLIHI